MATLEQSLGGKKPIMPTNGMALEAVPPASAAQRTESLSGVSEFLDMPIVADLGNLPNGPDLRGAVLPGGVRPEGADAEPAEDGMFREAVRQVTSSGLSPTAKGNVLNGLYDQFERDNRVDQQALITMAEAESANDVTQWQENRTAWVDETIGNAYAVENLIERAQLEVEALKSGGLGAIDTVQDFVTGPMLGWFTRAPLRKAFIEQTFGLDGDLLDNVNTANLQDQAREAWAAMSDEERRARWEALPGVIRDTQASFGDNDFDIEDLYQTFLGITGDISNYAEFRDGTITDTVLDLALAGAGLGGTLKTVKGLRTGVSRFSPAGMLSRVSPRAARAALLRGVEDPTGAAAAQMGATRGEIIDDAVASTIGAPTRGPDLVTSNVEDIEALVDRALATGVDPSFIFREGVDVVARRAFTPLDNQLTEIAEVGGLDLSKTQFGTNARGEVTATFRQASPDGQGFSDIDDALRYVEDHWPESYRDRVRVLVADEAGEYRPTESELPGDVGDYIVEIEYARDASTVGQNSSVFREGLKAGPVRSNLGDTAGSYARDIADTASLASFRTAQVKEIGNGILRPFSELGSGGQSAVTDVLRRGEADMRWYDDWELQEQGLNPREVEGYRAARDHIQWSQDIEEAIIRRELVDQGYSAIRSGGRVILGRKSTSSVDEVFFPREGRFGNPKEGAGEVYELVRPMLMKDLRENDVWVSHIYRGVADEAPTPIPTHFIGRTPGDMGRHVDLNYRVMEDITDLRGTTRAKAVRFASNPRAAARGLARDFGESKVHTITSLDDVQAKLPIEDRIDMLSDLGVLGAPADPQLGWSRLDYTDQKKIMSPAEALAYQQNRIASMGGMRELSNHLVATLERQYGDLLADGRMNWDGELRLTGGLEKTPRKQEARALQKKIKLMTGLDETYASGMLRNFSERQAEILAKQSADLSRKSADGFVAQAKASLLGEASDAAFALRNGAPVNFAKDIVQAAYIVYYPVRQMLLNASTATMAIGISGGTRYALSGALARDLAFVASAKGMKDLNPAGFDLIVSNYAKLAGVSKKSAQEMYDQLDGSGLWGSISSHQYLQNSGFKMAGVLPNRARYRDGVGFPGKVGQSVKDAGRFTRSVAQKGFEYGESVNLTTAYLVMRNRKLLQIGKGQLGKQDVQQVLAEAKQFTGNMDSANKSLISSGNAGLVFQFQAHVMKMMQLIIPTNRMTKRWASPVLSNGEKGKLIAAYGAMWGAGGYGVADQIISVIEDDIGFEMEPETREIIQEGLVGMGMEYAWEGVTGGELDTDISAQIGALTGTTSDAKIAYGLISGKRELTTENPGTPLGVVLSAVAKLIGKSGGSVTEHLGPSVSFAGNVSNAVGQVADVLGSPVLETGEKGQYALETMLRTLPGYNSLYQGRIARETGKVLSRRGDFVAESTWSEGLLRAFTGIRSQEELSVYDLREGLIGSPGTGRMPAAKREIVTSAKETAQQIAAELRWRNDGKLSREEAVQGIQAHLFGLRVAYPDQVQRELASSTLVDTLIEMVDEEEEGLSQFDQLVETIVGDDALHKELGWEKMNRLLRELPDSPQKETIITNLGRYFQGSFAEREQ